MGGLRRIVQCEGDGGRFSLLPPDSRMERRDFHFAILFKSSAGLSLLVETFGGDLCPLILCDPGSIYNMRVPASTTPPRLTTFSRHPGASKKKGSK